MIKVTKKPTEIKLTITIPLIFGKLQIIKTWVLED